MNLVLKFLVKRRYNVIDALMISIATGALIEREFIAWVFIVLIGTVISVFAESVASA
jgi:hypothetical protein